GLPAQEARVPRDPRPRGPRPAADVVHDPGAVV
ncbi:MAG: hypothetical protein AVDCRST_MAG13-3748, partial [uncultured Solirubrobacteraceae bacterium]